MIIFISIYLIIAILWFWYISVTKSTNWKFLTCWTIFLPCTCILVLGALMHMCIVDFIKWCKKEF